MHPRSLPFAILALLLAPALSVAQPLASVTLHGVDAERNDRDSLLLPFNEQITVRTVALHPYIYFSEQGSLLQDRYRDPRVGTNEPLPLRLNRRLLDTVAARMLRLPGEALQLIGPASKDPASQALAQRRCDTIRTALAARGVDQGRITITVSTDPTRTSSPAGSTMLRSVRLDGSPALLGSFVVADTFRTYSPATLRYRMEFNAEILRWHLTGTVAQRTYRLLAGETPQTVLSDNILPTEAQRIAEAGEASASLEITLPDSSLYVTAASSIPAKAVVIARSLARFPAGEPTSVDHLLLFPPDSSALSGATLEAVEELKRSIPAGSRVIVTGYADSTEGGNSAARRQLSLDRAQRVAEQLRSFAPVYDGLGAPPQDLPLATPEGRAFARVVRLIVAPPQTVEGR